MRILADENVPRSLVAALIEAGHDVEWVREIAAGVADERVIEQAARNDQLIVTFDKDFGELARNLCRSGREFGIILIRAPLRPLGARSNRVAELIGGRSDWAGHFSVIEPGRIRMKPLPLLR